LVEDERITVDYYKEVSSLLLLSTIGLVGAPPFDSTITTTMDRKIEDELLFVERSFGGRKLGARSKT